MAFHATKNGVPCPRAAISTSITDGLLPQQECMVDLCEWAKASELNSGGMGQGRGEGGNKLNKKMLLSDITHHAIYQKKNGRRYHCVSYH